MATGSNATQPRDIRDLLDEAVEAAIGNLITEALPDEVLKLISDLSGGNPDVLLSTAAGFAKVASEKVREKVSGKKAKSNANGDSSPDAEKSAGLNLTNLVLGLGGEATNSAEPAEEESDGGIDGASLALDLSAALKDNTQGAAETSGEATGETKKDEATEEDSISLGQYLTVKLTEKGKAHTFTLTGHPAVVVVAAEAIKWLAKSPLTGLESEQVTVLTPELNEQMYELIWQELVNHLPLVLEAGNGAWTRLKARGKTVLRDTFGELIAQLYLREAASMALSGKFSTEQIQALQLHAQFKAADARIGRMTRIRHLGGALDDIALGIRSALEAAGILEKTGEQVDTPKPNEESAAAGTDQPAQTPLTESGSDAKP